MNATEILLESKTARDGQLTQVSHEAASDVLSKAKALVFALWQGTGAATTQEMAEYYDVPVDAIESIWRRNRDELKSDGVTTLKGSQLKAFKYASVNLTEATKTTQVTIWTPRAALRLGMLLRDSELAWQVRTVLLDVAENGGDRISEPTPQPLPTQAELTAMLAQETVKLEKKVNVLIETAAEHDRAIAELKQKAATSSEPTAAPLTAKEQLRLEIEKVKLETVRERNRGLEIQAEAKKPSKSPILKLVPASYVTRILELAERKGGTVSARDISKSFTAKYRPTTQQVREWFDELVALTSSPP